MSSSYLISRLNSLKLHKDNPRSIGHILTALNEAIELAEDAVTEVVADELAIDKLLEPATDSDFWGDEGIK